MIKRQIELPKASWTMTEIELRTMPVNLIGLHRAEIHVNGIPLADFKLEKDKQSVWIEVYGYHKSYPKWFVCHRFGSDITKSSEVIEDRKNSADGYFPEAEVVDAGMPVRWKVDEPKGLIVHFTAGWDTKEYHAERTLKHGAKKGYTYMSIAKNGQAFQDVEVTEMGYHCGTAEHRTMLGVELCNPGKLSNQGVSWFGYKPDPKEIRRVHSKDNVVGGAYQAFSKAQERTLVRLILWLNETYKGFKIDNVLGHDEVAKKYKNDPGGALSMTLPEFRSFLHGLVDKGVKWYDYNG